MNNSQDASEEVQISGEAEKDERKCPFESDIYNPDHDATYIPETVKESLPTFIHGESPRHAVLEVVGVLDQFYRNDLDVRRLNQIHGHMWMCGRPMNARALHRQKMMGRRIVITEQADLHLLYYSDVIFVKPLPKYILSRGTWYHHLNKDKELHENACGFLLSYIWLLRSPTDFKMAEKEKLLPSDLKWEHWKTIVHEFLNQIDPDSLHQVNKRYHFGELRLGRINTVYRTTPRLFFNYFVRGYLYGYNRYKAFFQRSVGWVLVVFVWFSLVLSAMQVGVAVDPLDKITAFRDASYGFVVFSIVAVATLVAFVGGVFIVVFLYNMVAAILHARNQGKLRADLAERKKTA